MAEVDPTFTPKSFLEGAKQAYEMIVTAFAAGDRATLKNLLEKDVFDGFQRAITDREAAGQKIDFTFVGLPKVEFSDAEFDKKNVLVTIRFHAEVVSATRDKDGNLVEGNADQVQTIADEWTFARNPEIARSQLEARHHQPARLIRKSGRLCLPSCPSVIPSACRTTSICGRPWPKPSSHCAASGC